MYGCSCLIEAASNIGGYVKLSPIGVGDASSFFSIVVQLSMFLRRSGFQWDRSAKIRRSGIVWCSLIPAWRRSPSPPSPNPGVLNGFGSCRNVLRCNVGDTGQYRSLRNECAQSINSSPESANHDIFPRLPCPRAAGPARLQPPVLLCASRNI